MYARLTQQLSITSATQTVTTTALGSNALSLMLKDIARVITGQVSSVNDLNAEIWDTANSEIIASNTGWSEYQGTYTTTNTELPFTTGSAIYFRADSQNIDKDTNVTKKYAGLGYGNFNATYSYYWNMYIPYGVSNYTGDPTVSFGHTLANASATPTRNSFVTNVLTEYIIYATGSAIVVSATRIGASATESSKVVMYLEYPSTTLSSYYSHPNQVFWEVSNGNTTTTGTGAAFNATAYNVAGGYTTTTDIFNGFVTNVNLGLVYTTNSVMPSGGLNSLWSTTAGTADTSTLKPANYSTMADTVDAQGTVISAPTVPLLHYTSWDTGYDLTALTGIYGTKTGLGASGDTTTLEGSNYAYINATNMGYLIPRS